MTLAVLCEKVLHEADNVVSIIRIIDRITHTAVGPDAPDVMVPISIQLMGAVILKPGDLRGNALIVFRLNEPDERVSDLGSVGVEFEGGERGVQLTLPISMQLDKTGLYWIDLVLGATETRREKLLTRIPLRVRYQPITSGG